MERLLSCFRKPDESFEVFRSKDVAILALFAIGRKDSARLLAMIERIDPDFRRTVDAARFASTFCAEYHGTFLYLFRLYFSLVAPKVVIVEQPKKRKRDEDDDEEYIVEQNHGAERVKEIDTETHDEAEVRSVTSKQGTGVLVQAAVSEECMPYHYILSFLLLFMSIPDSNLVTWLFWLSYTAQGKPPDHNGLEQLIGMLWPSIDQHRDKVVFLKKKAQNMMIIVDPQDLDPSKLRMFDANNGGAWSRPIRMLRKRIRANSLGYFFWRRVSAHVDRIGSSIEDAYVRLKEPYKLTRWGKKNVALTGERKVARKEVRVIVRLHLKYLQLLSEHDGSDVTGSSRRGSSARSTTTAGYGGDSTEGLSTLQLAYLALAAGWRMLRKGAKRISSGAAQIHPMGSGTLTSAFGGSSAGKFSAKYSDKYAPEGSPPKTTAAGWVRAGMAQLRQATARPAPVIVDKEEFMSLEERYRETLQVPIDTVYRRVGEAQERALRMMELCDEEVGQTTFIPVDATPSSGSGLGGRGSRPVVVDVSDSEDGDSHDGRVHGEGIPDHAYGDNAMGDDGDGAWEEGDGYAYSDSGGSADEAPEQRFNAKPTVAPPPKVLKGIMKKR